MRDYSFGNFLHELRTRSGLTQFQLGALVGVSDKAVSKWENGSSKPQSGILSKLGEVLGISVDELLSCKYHSPDPKGIKGVFAMKKQLWNKALFALRGTYGDVTPLNIVSRYLTEQEEMQDTDMIVYWDMLASLSAEARKKGEHLRMRGGMGASLVAYLLGATDVNPLPPHYYCPGCHRVEFDDGVSDGWDLPHRICTCGKPMEGDGHGIPFETYRHVVRRNTSFDIAVSVGFFDRAKAFVENYFQDCDLLVAEQETPGAVSFSVKSDCSSCTVTVCADEELGKYRLLEQGTGVPFDKVPFCCWEISQAFASEDSAGIPEFCAGLPRQILGTVFPTSFADLIQILGLSHGTGTWTDNAETMVKGGKSLGDVIAYRDDVFRTVEQGLLKKGVYDMGCAYKIMEDTRRGRYVAHGISDIGRAMMREAELDEWFLESISKIRYLFPKAYGVTCVRTAAILMWYKLYYPAEFQKIML